MSLSNILKMSEEGWWMTTKISFPFNARIFSKSMMFSESLEDKPEVGSSTNITDGSRINSREIFNRFR